MDQQIFEYIRVVFQRLREKLLLLGIVVAVVSFGVLALGMAIKPKYETSITIYADNKNIIQPLLEGRASVTTPKTERIRIVRETMFSPRLLEEILPIAYSEVDMSDTQQAETFMAQLRGSVSLTAPADNYVKIAYAHESPQKSYQLVNKLASLFIEESAKSKRIESKSAFNFIDDQVKTYKAQLVSAENKLKSFEASNVDGRESQVNASIDRLRRSVDEIAINIEAEGVRIAALEVQLANESRFASNDYNARVYRDRLAQLESNLDRMRLSLRDQHPDVVEVRLQIQDIKRTIVEVESAKASGIKQNELSGESRRNPIYEELSNQLGAARVDVQTMTHRLAANESRLEDQYKRRVRVATNQAELSELTRDYDVTKQIYEDLLGRKEKARISMTLDMTGQGVTYKILEPAAFPVLPTGARFLHFVIAGPILGALIAIGALIASVLLNRTILFAQQLNELLPGIVLGVIPSVKKDALNWRYVTAGLFGFVATYSGVAASFNQFA